MNFGLTRYFKHVMLTGIAILLLPLALCAQKSLNNSVPGRQDTVNAARLLQMKAALQLSDQQAIELGAMLSYFRRKADSVRTNASLSAAQRQQLLLICTQQRQQQVASLLSPSQLKLLNDHLTLQAAQNDNRAVKQRADAHRSSSSLGNNQPVRFPQPRSGGQLKTVTLVQPRTVKPLTP